MKNNCVCNYYCNMMKGAFLTKCKKCTFVYEVNFIYGIVFSLIVFVFISLGFHPAEKYLHRFR